MEPVLTLRRQKKTSEMSAQVLRAKLAGALLLRTKLTGALHLNHLSDIGVHQIEHGKSQSALAAILFFIVLFNVHFFSIWQ